MCVGCNSRFKPLINSSLLCSLLFLSQSSNSHVFGLAYEQALTNQLISSGVSASQAQQDAHIIRSDIFGSAVQYDDPSSSRIDNTPKGRKIEEYETFYDYLWSEAVMERVSFKHKKRGEAFMFNINQFGNFEDKQAIKNLFSDKGFGEVVFKTYKSFDDLYNVNEMGDGYAVAPFWYGSSGMFVYRTDKPINSSGDYVYASNIENLYRYGVFLNPTLGLERNTAVKLYTDELTGKPVHFEIYKEETAPFEDMRDADLEFNNLGGNVFNLNYSYEVRFVDFSNDFEERLGYWKNLCASGATGTLTAGGNYSYWSCVAEGLEDEAYFGSHYEDWTERREEAKFIKLRADINNEDEDLFETPDEPESIPIYDNVSNHKDLDEYTVNENSLLGIFDKITEKYVRTGGGAFISGGGGYSGVSESTKRVMGSSFSFGSGSLGGVRLPTAKNFVDSKQDLSKTTAVDNKGRERYVSPGISTPADESEDNNINPVDDKDSSSDSNVGTDSGSTSGSGSSGGSLGGSLGGTSSGARDNNIADDKSGVITGADGKVNVNEGANTGAGVRDQVKPNEAEAENSDLDLPSLEQVSGIDILKPLLDWRSDLLSYVDFPELSGTCPVYSFDFFGSELEINSHCLIFDRIGALFTSVFMLIWSFVAFRILFSA